MTNAIKITLPYPISANRYWQSFVPRGATRALVHLSTEAKAYKRTVGKMLIAAGIHEPMLSRVRVTLQLYPNRPQDWAKRAAKDPEWDNTVMRLDIDNARKVVYDCLKGIAFVDDKLIFEDRGEVMLPDENGARIVVTIEPYRRGDAPAGLPGMAAAA